MKAESVDAARKIISDSESKIEELEHQLERYIIENNELAVKMEEAIQDSGWFNFEWFTLMLEKRSQ